MYYPYQQLYSIYIKIIIKMRFRPNMQKVG